MAEREEKMLFAISPDTEGGAPMLLIGIPRAAYEYIKDGKTSTFDLTKVGLPVKLVLYGAETHDAAKEMIKEYVSNRGQGLLDRSDEDFSVKVDDK